MEHYNHLRQIFTLLSSNGLIIQKSKCIFGVQELEYLGHLITVEGVRPLPSRIEVIRNFSTPDSRSSLQRFLGMINFYHRFLPTIASQLAPLHAASSGRGKELTWTTECQKAFENAKAALAHATLLHHPKASVQFSSVQFSFISAPPHEQNNKMLKSLCVVKDGLEKGRSNKTS